MAELEAKCLRCWCMCLCFVFVCVCVLVFVLLVLKRGNLPLGQNFIFGNEVFLLSDGRWAIVGVRVPGSMGGGLGNLLMEGVGFGWWDLLCMCSWICVRLVFCISFFLC